MEEGSDYMSTVEGLYENSLSYNAAIYNLVMGIYTGKLFRN